MIFNLNYFRFFMGPSAHVCPPPHFIYPLPSPHFYPHERKGRRSNKGRISFVSLLHLSSSPNPPTPPHFHHHRRSTEQETYNFPGAKGGRRRRGGRQKRVAIHPDHKTITLHAVHTKISGGKEPVQVSKANISILKRRETKRNKNEGRGLGFLFLSSFPAAEKRRGQARGQHERGKRKEGRNRLRLFFPFPSTSFHKRTATAATTGTKRVGGRRRSWNLASPSSPPLLLLPRLGCHKISLGQRGRGRRGKKEEAEKKAQDKHSNIAVLRLWPG